MSAYFFGLHHGHLTNRADRIARVVGGPGCRHVNHTEPNGERRGWFYAPNRGEPFNRDTARRVSDAIEKAGGIVALARSS